MESLVPILMVGGLLGLGVLVAHAGRLLVDTLRTRALARRATSFGLQFDAAPPVPTRNSIRIRTVLMECVQRHRQAAPGTSSARLLRPLARRQLASGNNS
jgi:hypothetical protein